MNYKLDLVVNRQDYLVTGVYYITLYLYMTKKVMKKEVQEVSIIV